MAPNTDKQVIRCKHCPARFAMTYNQADVRALQKISEKLARHLMEEHPAETMKLIFDQFEEQPQPQNVV